MKKLLLLSAAALVSAGMSAAVVSPVEIYPESGVTLNKLEDEVLVTFAEGTELAYNTEAAGYHKEEIYEDFVIESFSVPVYLDGEIYVQEEYGETNEVVADLNIYDNFLTVNFGGFSENFNTNVKNGTISVTVPEGSLIVNGEDFSAEIKLEYEIVNNSMDLPQTLIIGNDFFIYWDETIIINGDPEEDTLTVSLFTPADFFVPVEATLHLTTFYPDAEHEPGFATRAGEASNNALMLNLAEFVEKYNYGNYSFSLPEGSISNAEGKVYDGPYFAVYMESPQEAIPYSNIAATPNDITIYWEGYEVSVYNPENNDILIMSSDYTEEYRLTEDQIITEGDHVILEISALNLTDGIVYELTVPESYFMLTEVGSDEEDNQKVNAMIFESATYESTGINAIENSVNGNAAVYNLQGVKVGNSPEGLRKGIYVINGKKVLVK